MQREKQQVEKQRQEEGEEVEVEVEDEDGDEDEDFGCCWVSALLDFLRDQICRPLSKLLSLLGSERDKKRKICLLGLFEKLLR